MSNDDVASRLVMARKAAGYESARQAADALQMPYPTYAAHENGIRGIGRRAERYARHFGVSLDWLVRGVGRGPRVSTPGAPPAASRPVRLAGFVGAGQEIYHFEDNEAGWVEAPPGVSEFTEAVEVRGDSMLPLYEDGTILYYSMQLDPASMIGKRCVVRLEDERILVKSIRRGSEKGLYTLVSLNAPDIEDVALQWAAPIDWIKPR